LSYKFSKKHKDLDIAKIQIEAEDNFATQDDLGDKYDKVTEITTVEPTLTDMQDGETRVYNDGTDIWRYYRVGSRLFKLQFTEV